MIRQDLLVWLIFALISLAFCSAYYERIKNDVLRGILFATPLGFFAPIAWLWTAHNVRVWAQFDARVNFLGAVAPGLPYVAPQQVSTPFAFAFFRMISRLQDDTYDGFVKALHWANGAGIIIIISCLIWIMLISRNQRKGSLVSKANPLILVAIAGVLPAVRNMELGNHNILVAALVATQLLFFSFGDRKAFRFCGGFALGIAFALKPYLLAVLIYLFWYDVIRWYRKNQPPVILLGIFTAGAAAFLSSLLVAGINVETYRHFLMVVLPHITSSAEFLNHENNISWFVLVPAELRGETGTLVLTAVIFAACISAWFEIKRPQESLPGLMWYLITLTVGVFLWEDHLMGIFPALFVLVLGAKKPKYYLYSGAIITMTFFASIQKIAGITCLILFLLWLDQILLRLATYTSPARKPSPTPKKVEQTLTA